MNEKKPLISPVVGFAVGVAGLAAAGVAYYQLAQFVAKRNAEAPAPVVAAAPVEAGTTPASASAGTGASTSGAAGATASPVSKGARTVTQPPSPRTTPAKPAAVTPARALAGPPAAPVEESGFVTFEVPFALQVFVGGQSRGSTANGRLALPAGTHSVTVVNSQLEFRQTLPVTIQSGRAIQLTVPVPSGSLSVNALPWAEVLVNGSSVGITPLSNLTVPIGSHEIVWRHPTLGERRQTVLVKAQTPVRLGVDFNR